MLSKPPATTISLSPSLMALAPNMTAFIPLAHTLFTVVQIVSYLMSEPRATYLAGAYPEPADITLPIYTSSISFAST